MKRMMTLLVLSGLVGGVAFAMSSSAPGQDERAAVEAVVEAQIDARLHEVLVKMRLQRAELGLAR